MWRHSSASRMAVAAGLALWLAACDTGDGRQRLSQQAELGRRYFQQSCAQCHDVVNPYADRATGPALAGSSLELLEAKVLRGTYPPGYAPKRPPGGPGAMVVMPHLKDRLPMIHAFLAEAPNPDTVTDAK